MAVDMVLPSITALADATGFTVFGFNSIGVPLATAPGINNAGEIAFWSATHSQNGGIAAGGNAVALSKQEVTAAGNQQFGSTIFGSAIVGPTVLNYLLDQTLNNPDPVSFLTKVADDLSDIFQINGENRFRLPVLREPFSFDIKRFTTTIAPDGDQADIYYPQLPRFLRNTVELPIALMLQGALVDKSDYSNFASQVASYGFVVVVPNNRRTIGQSAGV